MPNVKFKRKHHDGLENSAVYVAGNRLVFVKDEAEISLNKGDTVDVYWRIAGEPAAKFSLKAIIGDTTYKVADHYEMPRRKHKKSDFAFFTVV